MFSENLVEFVDILPTLVEASGLPELEKCPKHSRDVAICREGTSLLRISEGNMTIYIRVFTQTSNVKYDFGHPPKSSGLSYK